MANGAVLAVYDFRSKQEYIYRTNHMREITGASELIANMFKAFLDPKGKCPIATRIRNDWNKDNPEPVVDDLGNPVFKGDEVGIVIYEGGGNLLVLFKEHTTFVQANREFSYVVVTTASTLSMIGACTDWRPNETLAKNTARAHRELDKQKRMGNASLPCNVLPFTQVDRVTFQPIVGERVLREEGTGEAIATQQVTTEAVAKLDAFDHMSKDKRRLGANIDNLGLKKGEDSLIAVMYFDGNSIGERVKAATAGCNSLEEEVVAMRRFSSGLHEELVGKTEEAMKKAIDAEAKEYRGYRVIIDHGDEITFICNAHVAPLALQAYFDVVEGSEGDYHACGGMVFCHTHDPFASVYSLAEECCESGKHRNRTEQANGAPDTSFVDFHIARSGITGSLDQIRAAQEGRYTARPYSLAEYRLFMSVGKRLANEDCKLQRSDIKALNRAILRGKSWYTIEFARLESKDPQAIRDVRELVESYTSAQSFGPKEMRDEDTLWLLLADVTSYWDVFDLAFRS